MRQESPQPHATIHDPQDGAVVPGVITVRGTVTDLPDTFRLWTVVHINGGFWPQRPAVVIRDQFTTAAFIGDGTPEHHGKQFDILVVAVDSDTDQEWLAYLEEGRVTGHFPPLLAIPVGNTPLDQITVILG